MDLTFIVCTYNPDLARLKRVLGALWRQRLSDRECEIVVIDNRSDPPVVLPEPATGHLPTRLVLEASPGLTAARRRGAREAKAPLLVYVDDDNVVNDDYARIAIALSEEHPKVGVFSAGRILPEYSVPPPRDIETYWPYMALIDLEKPSWSNQVDSGLLPMGAGMVVRSSVMAAWSQSLEDDPAHRALGRDGSATLFGGEDTDIGVTACGMGFACGFFPQLQLTHLIGADRLAPDYLKRLVRDVSYSTSLVHARGEGVPMTTRRLVKSAEAVARTTVSSLGSGGTAKRLATRGRLRAAFELWLAERR